MDYGAEHDKPRIPPFALMSVCVSVMPVYVFSAWSHKASLSTVSWCWEMRLTVSVVPYDTNTFTYTLSHTSNASRTHIYKTRKESLDYRSWNAYELLCWRTRSITLHILSEDSWEICAYSHNRHRSLETDTCSSCHTNCPVWCILHYTAVWNKTRGLYIHQYQLIHCMFFCTL